MSAVRILRASCLVLLGGCLAMVLAHAAWAGAPAEPLAAGPGATAGETAGEPAPETPGLSVTTRALIASLTIFVLAMFEGFDVITKVPPTLHTPLMSGSNAISGITVVGALVAAGCQETGLATILGTIAVAFAMINVVGGFLVTHRMLKMFKKK